MAPEYKDVVAETLMGDPLVVLGSGTLDAHVFLYGERIFHDGVGWTHRWKWSVRIEYFIHDWFKDPGHAVDTPGQEEKEWSGCKKYELTGTWTWETSGEVSVISRSEG